MSSDAKIKEILNNQEKHVRRVGTNADWAAGGNFDIFTITGAPVRVTALFGHVITAFTGAVPTPLLSFTPTGGGALTNISTIAVAAAWAINTLLMWNGLLATALVASIGIGHGATGVETFAGFLTFVPGVIRITNGGVLDGTGMVDWYISYVVCDPTSLIVAA